MPSRTPKDEESTERVVVMPPVRQLIRDRQVRVALQPIVSLLDGSLLAHEALVRSTSPDFRSPRQMFDAAVASGCCGELGRAIREAAIEAAPNDALFLNIHPNELHEGWLLELDDPIYKHPLDVYLEITESVPLTHFDICREVLKQIRDRGIRLVIDDLGAGYSNLRYIADLHPSLVKLDRALITGLGRSKRRQRLVASIVALCENLGAQVVAEGIESREELMAVRTAGVHYAQGYLLARPSVPPEPIRWPLGSGETAWEPSYPPTGPVSIRISEPAPEQEAGPVSGVNNRAASDDDTDDQKKAADE
jgi:EAL domain-containing protein (putative c-di-GMP-specific phosphodiesterase class I)